MDTTAADGERSRWQTEVLRRASAILGGKLVGVWEVRPDQSLVPVASTLALAMAENAAPKVREALRRIHMPSPPGSRWVGGQSVLTAGWCVAPVRISAPEPPVHRERRSRGRLALELAGLCLGLSDRLVGADEAAEAGRSRERVRGLLAPSRGFELLPVVRSAVDAAREAAAGRRVTIELETLGAVAPVTGDPRPLRQALALLVHHAVLALAGRPATVALTLADVGPVVRVTLQVPAVIPESTLQAARHLVETGVDGDLSVAVQPDEPATVVMLRLAARPALRLDVRPVRRAESGRPVLR